MLNTIKTMLSFFEANYHDIIVCGLIMVSAIIVGIGLLKPIIFNKIKNKHIRKAALALSNVAACFLTVLVYFLVQGWGFTYYFPAAVGLSVSCIITYWFYENTCLRNLIGTVGNLVLQKVLKVSVVAITSDDVNAVKTELKKAGDELKAHTKQELKKAAAKTKEDKDLTGL